MDHTGATAPKLKWGGLREDRGKVPVHKTDDPAFLKAAAPPAGCYVWSLLIFDEPNNLRITVYGPGQPGATNLEKVRVFEGAGGGKIISALEATPEGGMNMILSHIPNGPQLTVEPRPSAACTLASSSSMQRSCHVHLCVALLSLHVLLASAAQPRWHVSLMVPSVSSNLTTPSTSFACPFSPVMQQGGAPPSHTA